MSQTELENSFLTTGLPTDQSTPDVEAVESPELDFSAVESPTVDSPELFEYEGPFGIGPRPDDDLWFELRRKERREQRLLERGQVLDFYDNFNFGEDGSITFKDDAFDFDFDFDLGIDLREFGFELPKWNPKLKLEDAIPRLNFGYLLEKDMIPELDTPEFVKKFFEGVTTGLDNLISGIDLSNLESFKDNFDGYGGAGKAAYSAISQTLNFYENPSLTNAEGLLDSLNKASETFEKIGFESGSDLAKLAPSLSGFILDAGAVSDVAGFIDDPSITSAAQAYGSANYLLENFTDVGSLPGAQTDIARLAGNAITVINAATQLDDFFKDPDLAGAVATTAAVANAAAAFGSAQTAATAAQVAAFVNPIATAYAVYSVVKYLTYDEDFTRSDGIVSYKDGKFSQTFINGADGGPLAYTYWADAQTTTAANALNSLVNDYGFTVDERKMATIFNSHMNKSYITNNERYAKQGGRNHSSSNVDMVLSLLKEGALKPGENTPAVMVQDEATFGTFMGEFFKQMTNDAAAYMMDNRGFISKQTKNRYVTGYNYLPFADRESAQAYADKNYIATGVSTEDNPYGAGLRMFDFPYFRTREYFVNSDNTLTRVEGAFYKVDDFNKVFDTEEQAKEYIATNKTPETRYAYAPYKGQYIIGELMTFNQ